MNPDTLLFLSGLIPATTGFIIYLYLTEYSAKSLYPQPDRLKHVLFHRLTGITIFGILPILYLGFFQPGILNDFGGFSPPGSQTWLFTAILGGIVLITNYLNARSPQNLEMYPQIRKAQWNLSLLVLSALSWIAYLFAYELMFRALLFFPAVELLGTFPAIALNAGIYALVHIPKGKKEAIGSIFLGIILCLLVLHTGSFWIAFFIHIILALSNEWFSLYFQAEMDFKLK